MNTRTSLATWLDNYLADRRHAGFALKVEGAQLMRFVRFAEQIGHRGALTVKLAVQWACSSRSGKSRTAARRIEVIRPFAAYCQQFDVATQIPPRSLLGHAHRRLTPHIFTQDEILDLLKACDQLFPARRTARRHLRSDFWPDRVDRPAHFGGDDSDSRRCRSWAATTAYPWRQVRQIALCTAASHDDGGLTPLRATARSRSFRRQYQCLLRVRLRSVCFDEQCRVCLQVAAYCAGVACLRRASQTPRA